MSDGKWTTIKIPKKVYGQIKDLREKYGVATWKLILQGINFYHDSQRTHYPLPKSSLSRMTWYIFKVASSEGIFRENPNEENLLKFLKTLDQIRERIGVDTSGLEIIAKTYYEKPTTRNKIMMNDATRALIADIIVKFSEKEGGKYDNNSG